MTKTFFTSDTHFGHENIIKYCNRPWATVEEMNEGIIENWNSVVKPGDTVYHLGDFSFAPAEPFLDRLNGNIHLMVGNHEKPALAVRNRFVWVRDLTEVRVGKQSIVLCHYPLKTWNKDRHGAWHLYGHCHGTLEDPGNKSLDIGMDCHNYIPLSFEQVAIIMAGRSNETYRQR